MSQNATASWSGYAHQGKIGLLCALKKINSLHGQNLNLNNFTIEFETQEDVALKHNGTAIQVHQVKAYTDGTTLGPYLGALLTFAACAHDNFLHSICEITNWANLTAVQNPQNVTRYIYSNGNNFCSLLDIHNLIDHEISLLLGNDHHAERNNLAWCQETFHNFLGILDDKIRIEHQTKPNKAAYNINFTLEEVFIIIRDRPKHASSKLASIREELYNAFLGFLADLENTKYVVSQDQEDFILLALDRIYSLPDKDFEQFLRDINPHTTEGIKFGSSGTTDKYFVLENFKDVFLESIIYVLADYPIIQAKTAPHFFKGNYYLLTAINSAIGQIRTNAQRILKNSNINFSSYETDFIVTENYEGPLGSHASFLRDYDDKKFFNPKTISFIKKSDAIILLNT
jgi:hypothetical protein